jgi:hypothetical protein
MRIRLLVAFLLVGLAVACSADPAPTPTATSAPPGTVASPVATPTERHTTRSTTTTIATPCGALQFFRFDRSGLYFVDAAGEQQLWAGGVGTAAHDGMGGVLFTSDGEAWDHGLHWMRRGVAERETLNYLDGWAAVLDGGPTLIVGNSSEDCPETTHEVRLVDLQTGDERPLGCFGGEDGGVGVTCGGGELLAGTSWLAVGTGGTDDRIHLYDTMGHEVDHPANPVAESCAPCELDVHLSPDGARLAYRLRPDAKWSEDPVEADRIDRLSYEEWWETSKEIAGTIHVIDLASGEDVFSMAVPAGERLVDFDGCRMVVESCDMIDVPGHDPAPTCVSRVVDIRDGTAEIVVAGSVRLATQICCNPPAADVFPPLLRVWSPWEGQVVDSPTYRFEGIADPDAEVVAAGRYPVTVEPDGAWSIVLVLRPGQNVATITAADDAGNTTTVKRAVTHQPSPPPPIVIASAAGITLLADGAPEVLVDVPSVRVAFRLSEGTVVYQREGAFRDEHPAPVMIVEPGGEPVELVGTDGVRPVLWGVGEVGGSSVALYERWPVPCGGQDSLPECRGPLVALSLDDGSEQELAGFSAPGYGLGPSAIEGGIVLVYNTGAEIGELGSFRLTDLRGNSIGNPACESAVDCSQPMRMLGALAPGGQNLAYVLDRMTPGEDVEYESVDRTYGVVDIETGQQLVSVDLDVGGSVAWLDFNGEQALVSARNDAGDVTPYLVDSDGAVGPLAFDGVATFAR